MWLFAGMVYKVDLAEVTQNNRDLLVNYANMQNANDNSTLELLVGQQSSISSTGITIVSVLRSMESGCLQNCEISSDQEGSMAKAIQGK